MAIEYNENLTQPEINELMSQFEDLSRCYESADAEVEAWAAARQEERDMEELATEADLLHYWRP